MQGFAHAIVDLLSNGRLGVYIDPASFYMITTMQKLVVGAKRITWCVGGTENGEMPIGFCW